MRFSINLSFQVVSLVYERFSRKPWIVILKPRATLYLHTKKKIVCQTFGVHPKQIMCRTYVQNAKTVMSNAIATV